MPTHRTPHHFLCCHSGACAARTRNPFIHQTLPPDGFRARDFVAPRNDGESYATISFNTPINASGAVTFGA